MDSHVNPFQKSRTAFATARRCRCTPGDLPPANRKANDVCLILRILYDIEIDSQKAACVLCATPERIQIERTVSGILVRIGLADATQASACASRVSQKSHRARSHDKRSSIASTVFAICGPIHESERSFHSLIATQMAGNLGELSEEN